MNNLLSFLIGLISGLASNVITIYVQKDGDTAMNLMVISGYFIFLFTILIIVYRFYRHDKSISLYESILKNIASNKRDSECALYNYGDEGYAVAQINETWAEFIKSLLITTKRDDLDYYNFGKEYYFFDFMSGSKINIPTDNDTKRIRVKELFRAGMVLRLMPNKEM